VTTVGDSEIDSEGGRLGGEGTGRKASNQKSFTLTIGPIPGALASMLKRQMSYATEGHGVVVDY